MFFVNKKLNKINSSFYTNLINLSGVGLNSSKKLLAVLGSKQDAKVDVFLKLNLNNLKFDNFIKGIEFKLPLFVVSKSFSDRVYEIRRIDRLIYSKSYRGRQHKFVLPVRGQRTRSNRLTQRKLGLVRLALVKKERNFKY